MHLDVAINKKRADLRNADNDKDRASYQLGLANLYFKKYVRQVCYIIEIMFVEIIMISI